MNEQQYRQKIDELSNTKSFIRADEEFYAKLDKLTEDTKKMIASNMDDMRSEKGNTYYVSTDGDDSADGLSPETAWKTLQKVTDFIFSEGDVVVFRRGDLWYGDVIAQSGVSYSAYGEGPKPKIFKAYDAMKGEWVKTDIENVWKYNTKFDDNDLGNIVFNDGECNAQKKLSINDLKEDLDFVFSNAWSNDDDTFDNCVYLRCDKGNPQEIFNHIDISRKDSIIKITKFSHDITIKNLELRYAQDIFFVSSGKEIHMSYCICGWTGGTLISKQKQIRYGGGAGGWLSCENMTFDHCYIYQQFDSGVTPQYHWTNENAGIFRNFITTDCVFENCEYTLEYFHTQKPVKYNGYENMVFDYNICRKGGHGFGDKTPRSAYVKSWGHENTCINCEIAHNIFDRAAALSLEIIGHEFGEESQNISYDCIPKLFKNVYIEPENKEFANINHIRYKFNIPAKKTLEKLGADVDSVYIFSE